MIIKINSFVDVSDKTETEALVNALSIVQAYDVVNNKNSKEAVITKLYYIVPVLGKIFVVINDEDKAFLGLSDNILANVLITDYPLVKVPSQIVEYREVIVKIGSTLTDTEILDAAQVVANRIALDVLPDKIPVIKVVNYNNSNPSKLVMPSIFGTNLFYTILIPDVEALILNSGNPVAGETILDTI